MKVNETCVCGCGITAASVDPAAVAGILEEWRSAHPCTVTQDHPNGRSRITPVGI